MSFQYIDVEEAVQRGGLRMVVVGGVPSPWGEAAKGIMHVKVRKRTQRSPRFCLNIVT